MELANCTLDVLRSLVARPAGQAITPAIGNDEPLSVKEVVITARQNLEAVLVYVVTQLGMWMSKPEFELSEGGDIEIDEKPQQASSDTRGGGERSSRKGGRSSIGLAERLRRGMTGDMGTDLDALLVKAKPVIAKSDGVLGNSKDAVDLTTLLSHFVQSRIIVPV